MAVPFALIALAIKLDSKGPVFFRQERVGLNGRVFKTWKFRTMAEGAVTQHGGHKQTRPGLQRAGLCRSHPSAPIARGVSIGPGTVVMAHTAVNSDTKVGENVIINTGATIDHDCVIEDFVRISPGVHLAGNVRVEELSHIGIGASIVQGVKTGKDVIIGAGAAVIDDIPATSPPPGFRLR